VMKARLKRPKSFMAWRLKSAVPRIETAAAAASQHTCAREFLGQGDANSIAVLRIETAAAA
jgi:hypothetical protein